MCGQCDGNRCMATCDIPGAFMHADMDEVVHVKLEGKIAKLLLKVDSAYNRYLIYEHDRPVIYTELNKALYGTLQAALLFWTNLKKFFIDKHGCTKNPYDSCVVIRKFMGSNARSVGTLMTLRSLMLTMTLLSPLSKCWRASTVRKVH